MSGSPSYTNTNPNAKGGSFNYDARTGLGYGSLGGDPNSRLGKEYSGMGDALSSPKGQWDDIDLEDLEEEDFDDIDSDIEAKISLSLNRTPTDSLAYKGTDISYYGGLGNSIASVIAAGHKPSGSAITEVYLKKYIKEYLFSESVSISGGINVARSPKAKNTGGKNPGTVYRKDNTTLGSMNGIHNGAYIKHDGYRQRRNSTTDGAETVRELPYEENISGEDQDKSTYEKLVDTTSKEFYDEMNVRYQNMR